MNESNRTNEIMQELKKEIEKQTRSQIAREREEHDRVNAIDRAYINKWNDRHEQYPQW